MAVADQITVLRSGRVVGTVSPNEVDPEKLASMLNFTLDGEKQKYVSDDPEKIPARIVNLVQVLFRNEVQGLPMRDVLKASEKLVTKGRAELTGSPVLASLGIDVLDLSVIAIKPTPGTARALEAGVREQLLKEADEAIYGRRNAAIQQERAICSAHYLLSLSGYSGSPRFLSSQS